MVSSLSTPAAERSRKAFGRVLQAMQTLARMQALAPAQTLNWDDA